MLSHLLLVLAAEEQEAHGTAHEVSARKEASLGKAAFDHGVVA